MKFKPIRGTHDIFGQEVLKYNKINKIINKFSDIYGFNEIITPIFESTDLFKKPLGEQSDVVLKEMYTFSDRNKNLLTLRPEYTTPMLRAAISNNLIEKLPQKFYGIGPMFRRERPQKGRYRQFNQINFEILGTHDIISDVELIILGDNILKELFPSKKISLYINSLGDKNTLNIYKNKLTEYFTNYKNDLSEESKNKILSNPLRILDSKITKEIEINNNAPKISDFYSKEAIYKFDNLQNFLSNSSINYLLDPYLVRGLDYYCHTVFEFKTNDLGSQDTLIGGGRYDGLIKILGGKDIPGVGWAGGVERMIMLMEEEIQIEKQIYLIILNENYREYGLKIANKLRSKNLKVFLDYKYNLKKSLSNANKINSTYAIIIGENETEKQLCTIKYLKENFQETKQLEEIIKDLI